MCETMNDARAAMREVSTKLENEINYLIYKKGVYHRAADERYKRYSEEKNPVCKEKADKFYEKAWECHTAIKILENLKAIADDNEITRKEIK